MTDQKAALRDRARRERSQKFIPSNFNVILRAPEIESATTIASYISYEFEPSTAEINEAFLRDGKVVVLPRINGDQLEWVRWDGDPTQLVSKKKITEPTGDALSDLSQIQAVIVPALKIDQSGFRLGQGGGYYDRALVHLDAWKIGLVYAGELSSETLPHESHDVPLDAAATPSIVVRFNR
jgi:5-formyltetrahydrofolate cyclo-ligase